MEGIREAISSEAPQMRNALEEVSGVSVIECQLTFYRDPHLLGFLSRMSFGEHQNAPAHMIFSLTRGAAEEIAKRDQEARALRLQLRGIERVSVRVDSDDWVVFRERSPSRTVPRPRLAPGISDETNSAVLNMIRTSESYEDFKDRLSGYASEIRGRLSNLLVAEGQLKFETFSGEATVVPGYVAMIIELISNLKLHHLSEHREPIGADEANRILRLKTSRGQSQLLRDLQGSVSELLGVQIDAFSSDADSGRVSNVSGRASAVAAELDVDEFLVQVNGSGSVRHCGYTRL